MNSPHCQLPKHLSYCHFLPTLVQVPHQGVLISVPSYVAHSNVNRERKKKKQKQTNTTCFVLSNNKLCLSSLCSSENKRSEILTASLMLSPQLLRYLCNEDKPLHHAQAATQGPATRGPGLFAPLRTVQRQQLCWGCLCCQQSQHRCCHIDQNIWV